MSFIRSLFYFLSPYVDARERSVGLFFKGLTERSSQPRIRSRLGELLQRNIAIINLWTEHKYKGYRYLRKSQRKNLYANLQLIADDFDRFYKGSQPSDKEVTLRIRQLAPSAIVDPKKAALLQVLMNYFSPNRGVYEYRESSSFGRLLRDPSHEKLVGDCNQIVTLYIYLYSRYHDVRDLKIRMLPGHIALHYKGIDIEATNGTFTNYNTQKDSVLLPVEEIVSINLLDTTDAYLSTHEVAAEDFLQSARFAFILSHDRDIVTRNLEAAYGRLINTFMKRNNYKRALEFAKASRDATLLGVVGHNGAVYEMTHDNYAAARRFAEYAPRRDDLIRNSWQAESLYHYQAHRYHDAIRASKHIGDQTFIHQCYEALFLEEQQKLGPNLTTESIKKYASVVRRMQDYAKKSGNQKLSQYANDLGKHL